MGIKFLNESKDYVHALGYALKQGWERNRRNVSCILGVIQGNYFRSSDKQN